MDARARFQALIERVDDDIPLAEAALWLAAESRPEADVAGSLRTLDALAERARAPIDGATSASEAVERLNDFLFVQEGFRGNDQSYHDPRNSFLDLVLERRVGIPISLAIVYVEVARRLSLDAVGVGFPGHFLAKVRTSEGDVLVDAFHGRRLDRPACEALLQSVAGPSARLEARFLAATSHRDILRRMLTNLKQIHVSTHSFDEALACCDRLLLLAPEDPGELRDRGLVLHRLECFAAARADLERFIALAPDDPSRPAIQPVLDALRRVAPSLH